MISYQNLHIAAVRFRLQTVFTVPELTRCNFTGCKAFASVRVRVNNVSYQGKLMSYHYGKSPTESMLVDYSKFMIDVSFVWFICIII